MEKISKKIYDIIMDLEIYEVKTNKNERESSGNSDLFNALCSSNIDSKELKKQMHVLLTKKYFLILK